MILLKSAPNGAATAGDICLGNNCHRYATSKEIVTMNLTTKSTKLFVTAASFFALAASANASDLLDGVLDQSADQPAGVSVNWSGVYVGGRVGVGNANHDLTLEGHDGNENGSVLRPYFGEDTVEEGGTVDLLGLNGVNSLGIIGGGQIGADKQMGNFVVGVFGSYDISNMETEFTLVDETEVIASKEHEWSAGARLGYLVNPDTLLYGLAAYTETKYDIGDDDSHTFEGVTAGVGIEFAATRNVFLGLEATHTFYNEGTLGTEIIDLPGLCNPACDTLTLKDDLDETKIMGTLKIKLNSF
jgi:outer membrane immunogenic protein